MDDEEPKVTHGLRKSNMADGHHLESHQVPTTQLWTVIFA